MPAWEPHDLALRPATHRDDGFLYDLHIRTMKTYVEQTWGWDEAKAAQMFRERVARGRYEIVVLSGVEIGAVNRDRQEGTIYVSNIEVLPEYQRRGVGTEIMRRIIAEARRDCFTVTLRVLKVNPARRLYERLGFVVTKEDEIHYYMRRG
jgi:ribosomal protein S18 acetylase RimI-like enzyme